ncbi:Capsule biosynthesis protein CapA [compost metagenome]
MPLSRSEKYNKQKKRRHRKTRVMMMVNLTLLLMIGAVVGVYFWTEHTGAWTNSRQAAAPNPEMADNSRAVDEHNDAQEGSGDAVNSDASVTEQIGTEEEDTTQQAGADEESADANPTDDSGVADAPDSSEADEWRDVHEVAGGGTAATEDMAQQETIAPIEDGDTSKGSGSGDRVLLHFVGDIQFSGKVEERLESKGFDFPYQYLGDLFRKDDLTVGNLETPVTTRGQEAEDKTYVYKSSPKALSALAAAGMDAVNLANNHILDQGVEGLLDTMSYLQQYGIGYMGAGKQAEQAYAPIYYERNGTRIALLGFSRVIPKVSWYAGKGQPGVAGAYDSTLALKAIREARKQADLVIVTAHWGKEKTRTLEVHQSKLAHEFIDAGADLVMGGHPHVLQGLEQYKGKWIAYSTGNFIFSKALDPLTLQTAIFQASCTKQGDCQLQLIPYRTELGQPVPMGAEEASQLYRELTAVSIGGARIQADGRVTAR